MSRERSSNGGCVRTLNPTSSSPFIRRFHHQISSPTEIQPRLKRVKVSSEGKYTSIIPSIYGVCSESKYKRKTILSDVIDYSDPSSVFNMMEKLDHGTYGSVSKDIEDVSAQSFKLLNNLLALYPSITLSRPEFSSLSPTSGSLCTPTEMVNLGGDLESLGYNNSQVVILDSDDEEQIGDPQAYRYNPVPLNCEGLLALPAADTILDADRKSSSRYQEVVLKKPSEENAIVAIDGEKKILTEHESLEAKKDEGIYVGVHDDLATSNRSYQNDADDGLGDIWTQMTLALECSKEATGDVAENTEEEEEDCDHSYLLKEDLGYVCRVCGVIKKSIETIFDFQWVKGSKTTRTYMSEPRSIKDKEENNSASFSSIKGVHDLAVTDISVHPRHMQQMKSHQLEGFSFLVKNLISDNPGGCILAHAPGSGKTFMIISFIQSFLAKYPQGRPLVVLPKGILATWKKEFLRWQVEDMPLYDFYSAKGKGEARKDQLAILKKWHDNKGILFLGYKQFSNIICNGESDTDAACQKILLEVPSLLILDEGHTPRNEETDILRSLEKVQTPRKVVLSGTLFQNHVREVFNILNLARPRFLKSETSKAIKRRIMGRGLVGGKKQIKSDADASFFDVVEATLQNDEHSKVKVAVIEDLREMTKNVLHYYKGDFLDELPGLVDYTVYLNLTPKQKYIVERLKKMEKFKRTVVGTVVYVHPQLKEFSENAQLVEKGSNLNETKLRDAVAKMDVRDGVKAKFFLNLLALCESSGEKLLVFSQYILPLKFLEKLVVQAKGWSLNKQIFMIYGKMGPEDREHAMDSFNNSSDAKVFFGSIKACGEGISLVGASRVLIMDVHLNPSVTRQAIGRAFRPGQLKKVYVYRLVAADSEEEESHKTSFRKELISKMWFEWSEFSGNTTIEMGTVNLMDSDDHFWGSHLLREDVNVVKKR
ncbi:hypothetical protein ACHQM5_015429 [Ranunculus cassubicifolius]